MPFYSSDKNENIKDYDAINPIQDGPFQDHSWKGVGGRRQKASPL